MAEDEDDGTFSAPWWKERAEKAEAALERAEKQLSNEQSASSYDKSCAEAREAHLQAEAQEYKSMVEDQFPALMSIHGALKPYVVQNHLEDHTLDYIIDHCLSALHRLQTPADDRQLAEIRQRQIRLQKLTILAGDEREAAYGDVPYLLSEINRLRGVLASYADSRPLRETKTSDGV